MSGLPSGWAVASIGEITAPTSQRVPGDTERFLYIDIASVDRETKSIASPQELVGKNAPSRARKEVQAGDVLVSMTRPNLNAVALVVEELDGSIASTGFDVLRAIEIEPRWLFAHVRSKAFIDAMSDLVQGALYPAVRPQDVRSFEIVVPPLNEQKRIADKLDRLLTRVNATKTRLGKIPVLVKRLRQSILSAATSGSLTEEWRKERNIVAAWREVSLASLGELGRGKSKHRPRNDPQLYGGPYPFIQTGQIAQSNGYITSHAQTYSKTGLEQSRLWPAGTVCITIAANIADTAILTYPACFPDSVVGFVADTRNCVPLFVKWSVDAVRSDLEMFAPATAQKNINLAVLNDVRISCPSLLEQQEIVRRVEELFAIADRIEAQYQAARARVDRLTQSLLAKAFRGELVPQDPNDEPASVLLDRIRAQRAAAPAERRGGRGRPVAAELPMVAEPKGRYARGPAKKKRAG